VPLLRSVVVLFKFEFSPLGAKNFFFAAGGGAVLPPLLKI